MMGHSMGKIRVLLKGHNDPSNMSNLRGIRESLMWPVSHNQSGYPPFSSTSDIISPLHYFVFLSLHFIKLFLSSESAYLSSSFQQKMGSTEVVVSTIPVSPLKKKNSSQSRNRKEPEHSPGGTGLATAARSFPNQTVII